MLDAMKVSSDKAVYLVAVKDDGTARVERAMLSDITVDDIEFLSSRPGASDGATWVDGDIYTTRAEAARGAAVTNYINVGPWKGTGPRRSKPRKRR